MKKNSSFKLRSGNKPSVAKLSGVEKSPMKKMPETVKGKGNFTYRYTSPQEMYDKKFPPEKYPNAKPAVYVNDQLEIKSKFDKGFTTVKHGSDEYDRIMKEIGGKLKTKPRKPKIGDLLPNPNEKPKYKYAK
tara:strand:- start:516 stop:911 length:396 start_codon:yes stop_codon:yes gene_type:complete